MAHTNTNVFVVGNNLGGGLGLRHTNNVKTITQLITDLSIKHIYSGYYYSIYYDGQHYYAAGNNKEGKCGVNNGGGNIMQLTKINKLDHSSIQTVFVNPVSYSTFYKTENGMIYVSGLNNYHQFGLPNDNKNKFNPIKIEILKNIKQIATSHYYTLALHEDGSVYSTGYSQYNHGEHGHHPQHQIKEWTKIKTLNNTKIIKIICGRYHSVLLDIFGNIWTFGRNDSGECGLGNKAKSKPIPSQITNLKIIFKDIECGANHNLALSTNKRLYSWGRNRSGQCGNSSFDDVLFPEIIHKFKDIDIIYIQCGYYHSYAKTINHDHYLWGENQNNECSLIPDKNNKISPPKLMNETIAKETNHLKMKQIYLGHGNTKIICFTCCFWEYFVCFYLRQYKLNSDNSNDWMSDIVFYYLYT
eukprot:514701_1